MGSSFNEIVTIAKKKFKEVNVFKPPASRKDSKESFIICKILRQFLFNFFNNALYNKLNNFIQ